MSLFGNNYPKFIDNGTTVLLEHGKLDPEWMINDIVEYKSTINGTKQWEYIGDYAKFKVTVYLNAYGDNTAIKNKFNEIMSHKFKYVIFYPFSDGNPIQDSSGTNVLCFITSVKYYNYNGNKKFHLLEITFEPQKHIDVTKNVL